LKDSRQGSLLVKHGKTPAARRVLPLTTRVRSILEHRWTNAGKPEEGWVWPGPTSSGHVEPSTIKKQHKRAFKMLHDNNPTKAVRPFVLYTLRHTFLTGLGEAECNVWTPARIAGHSSIAMSARYVHPSDDSVLSAISKLRDASPSVELADSSQTTKLLTKLASVADTVATTG
jgi:integrase